jgi:DNA-binding GntR family transcriptional regulator
MNNPKTELKSHDEYGKQHMLTAKIKSFDFKPEVLGDQIAVILAEAILEGKLKGGDRLIEVELQKHFGISRSPLREAFRNLEKKGLVTIIPRKGTFVKRITRRDIEENFPVRATLEGLAARETHKRISDKILSEMTRTLSRMENAAAGGDTRTYWKHHLLFHDHFINASGNEVLINILKTLRMHSLWHRFSYRYYQEDLQKSLAVHRDILNLLQNPESDGDEIEALVRRHIAEALEKFLTYLDAPDSP